MSNLDLENWLNKMQVALKNLQQIDAGYPEEDNYIRVNEQKAVSRNDIPDAVQEFYSLIEEIILTDVFVGYFVHSCNDLYEKVAKGWSPQEIKGGNYSGEIFAFGTTGGGDFFSLHLESGKVVLLPSHGLSGKIYDGDFTQVKYLADNFDEFLIRLLADFVAFVDDKPDWQYMV